MNTFEFTTTPKISFGHSVAVTITGYCLTHRISRVLIVTDQQIAALGLMDELLDKLADENVAYQVFDNVEPDPSSSIAQQASNLAVQTNTQLVVGFGGGSSLDIAKVVSILATPHCKQSLAELYGVNKVEGQRLPLLLVPTTAGTGSEVTPISILTTGGTTKAGIVSQVLLPDMAILDPELTLGLPAAITAATGIDAMVHAIEAYTSRIKKNPISDGLACNALKILHKNIRTAVFNGLDKEARGQMMLGSMFAGQAFANAPVGGVHALAYPLGGHFHIPHGLSNALMLPHVLRFNLNSAATHYGQLADIICDDTDSKLDCKTKALRFIEELESLSSDIGLPCRLRDCGVNEDALKTLAKDAMLQQRLLVNNPVAISEDDALLMYQAAF